MKFLLRTFLLVLFLSLISTNLVDARSGCCSWHGGVCGGSCCDGTPLSPVCSGSYYSPPTYYIQPQVPAAPQLTAKYDYVPNDNGTFDVTIDWSDTSNTGYSIMLQKTAGADPGPNTDTYGSKFTFTNVYPGTYYANLKVGINYRWSSITYWKVVLPMWYPPVTPTPSPMPPIATTSIPIIDTNEESNHSDYSGLIILGMIGVGFLYAFYSSIEEKIKKKRDKK